MGELGCRPGVMWGLPGWSRAELLVRLHLMEGLSVQLHPVFSARPHFRGVGVSARLHTAPEVPLGDIMAGEVLLGDFMEAEEAADFMEVEVEVAEVTAKRHSLFPIHYPDQYSGLLRLGRFGIISLRTYP